VVVLTPIFNALGGQHSDETLAADSHA